MIRRYTTKEKKKISFYEEFCEEIDLFSLDLKFPEWIFSFREQNLAKLTSKFKQFCRKAKQKGLKFKICFPMQIDGKWKFADVYIPSKKTVVIVNTLPHSPGYLSQRAAFFQDRCRVYELDGYESEVFINSLITTLI